MKTRSLICAGTVSALLTLAGCASQPGESIYVPAGGTPKAPEPPRTSTGQEQEQPRVWRKSEQPQVSEPAEPSPRSSSPSYQDAGERLSPAAMSLVREAESLLAQGNASAAIARLERAQRIAPRSAEVYFKLSEAYVASNQLGTAEQFTLKGLSLAGSDTRMQRAGWLLLADIRRARGNVAGADQAEARAANL
ncbi:tetratricopeptide repeat protein [Marinobacter qingdaonensis]|uniref:Tetratricopeptide repeat protein n=1 Tax=Marinobacter qingdaonensis TaxID=3108486 RepID=A0ABU5NV52_9GAMM|nr:tetratricopeptide repeat protein [Marinobacter sp. ASW11-75]MEA1079688.1 tetratricopeptide repeat protein [Marinobacter sp. ASW11-75]